MWLVGLLREVSLYLEKYCRRRDMHRWVFREGLK